MEALKRNGYYYFLVIVCFTIAALAVAGVSRQAAPVYGDGNGCLVVIDPGHGGEDGGAVSVTDVQEKDINLEISLRVRELLHLCGIQTVMTREDDSAIYDEGCSSIVQKKASDLKNRAKMVNDLPGAILLSIHQNQFPEEKYSGAQVFYNAAPESETLAKQIQEALRCGLDAANQRQCKLSSGVYLMEHIHNPGILVECGFLSNRKEEALLRTEEYQKKLSCAVCAGLLRSLTEEVSV